MNPEAKKQWEYVYETLKNGINVETLPGQHLLNSAIINGAPEKTINIIIDSYPELTRIQDNYGNTSLHYALSREEPNLGVIRHLFDVYPEALHTRSFQQLSVLDVIPDKVRKNKKTITRLLVLLNELESDFNAYLLLQEEHIAKLEKQRQNERRKDKKSRKQLLERKRNESALVIQRYYKQMKNLRSLKQRGVNQRALPFQSNTHPLLRVLPDDDLVVNPWKYHN
jgi:hypothetical protein